jgi:hypothetical protein
MTPQYLKGEGRKVWKDQPKVVWDVFRGNIEAVRVVCREGREKPYPLKLSSLVVNEEITPRFRESARRQKSFDCADNDGRVGVADRSA